MKKKLVMISICTLLITTAVIPAIGGNLGAPAPPTIDGPTQVVVGTLQCWTFNSTDPDNDDIYYIIDWRDGTINETDCFPSGTTIESCHNYSLAGTYYLRAKAVECSPGTLESDWSVFKIKIPREKALSCMLSFRLSNLFPYLLPILRQIFKV